MIKVTRNSSVDISQFVIVAEFATMVGAREYVAANTVDGINVSIEIDCDYFEIVSADDAG